MADEAGSLKEKYEVFLKTRGEVEQGDGLVSEALADAYFAVTGVVLPAEFIGEPMRKFNGWSFDFFNVRLERAKK